MSKTEEKSISETVNEKIAERNNWFKIISLTLLLLVVAYKIAVSELNFDFSDFVFSDLLSLLLAIFAISLSVAFYFQATNMSNKFYDNTYKFTKEISGILGRIEAGFGERLRHLDEGYTGLVDKFDSSVLQSNPEDIEIAKKEFEEEKKKLETEVEEKNKILSTIIGKAKLNEKEKEEVLEKLSEKESEISNLRSELRFLKRNINSYEKSLFDKSVDQIRPSIIRLLTDFINVSNIDLDMINEAPASFLERKLVVERSSVPRNMYNQLRRSEFITNEGKFTPKGIEVLKTLASNMSSV